MRLPFGPRHMRPGTIPRTPSLPFILACVSHLSSTACLPRRRQLLPAAFGRQQLCGATINGYLVPELNGFKAGIDTMLTDLANHPLREPGRSPSPRSSAAPACTADESCADFVASATVRAACVWIGRLSVLECALAVDQDARLGPRIGLLRLYAVGSVRLWASCSESAGEGPQPLSRVSRVLQLVY